MMGKNSRRLSASKIITVGAPLKSPPAYFLSFILTALLAEQQRLLLPNEVLHEKKKSFQKLEILPFLYLVSLNLKELEQVLCRNRDQFSGTPRAPASRCPMGLGKGSLGFCYPSTEPFWQTQHSAILPFSGWSSETNELIPGRAKDIIWQISTSLLASCSRLLFPSATSPKPVMSLMLFWLALGL